MAIKEVEGSEFTNEISGIIKELNDLLDWHEENIVEED